MRRRRVPGRRPEVPCARPNSALPQERVCCAEESTKVCGGKGEGRKEGMDVEKEEGRARDIRPPDGKKKNSGSGRRGG